MTLSSFCFLIIPGTCCSVAKSCLTPWTIALQAPLSFTVFLNLLKFMSIDLVIWSNHLILCHPFLLWPSVFPSIRVFSKESALRIKWPKYWSFSISPSNEYSGFISFRIDWFDLLSVQGILKNLLQQTAWILWYSAFFMVHLLHHTWLLKNYSFAYMAFCRHSDVSAF